MARIFCIANQKGGVGKTSTAINLGAGLGRAGYKTLIIDLDPQCNATSGLGGSPLLRHPLVTGTGWSDSIFRTDWENLFLLPGCRSFADITTLTGNDDQQARRLREQLSVGTNAFDYVFIDSPPSLGQLTRSALACANEVLMPIQCEYFAMEGLTQMIQLIKSVMEDSEVKLEFSGILLTMVDPGLELTHEVESEVREFFGEIVYQTVIPRDVSISEASSYGQPVLEYAPRSRAARAYIELCMEVIENE
ncbi:MAG: ParA family protein [Planctomycetia bacterium]|nr:ParA family protein [Planctomycetia bacterium]